jgi:IS30 family transposase
LKRDHPGLTISHEAIYQWVYSQGEDYHHYLVRAHKKRRWQGYRHGTGGAFIIPRRVSIRERPAGVADRQEWGHWEVDTMVDGYRRAGIQVITERKARYVCLTKLVPLNAQVMQQTLAKRLLEIPVAFRKTLTYDNGSENVGHTGVNDALGTRSYFCDPYQSWQRGTVENTIGLVRRFLPKKTDLTQVDSGTLQKIERWINTLPRKCLNYRTPEEVFKAAGVALAP